MYFLYGIKTTSSLLFAKILNLFLDSRSFNKIKPQTKLYLKNGGIGVGFHCVWSIKL